MKAKKEWHTATLFHLAEMEGFDRLHRSACRLRPWLPARSPSDRSLLESPPDFLNDARALPGPNPRRSDKKDRTPSDDGVCLLAEMEGFTPQGGINFESSNHNSPKTKNTRMKRVFLVLAEMEGFEPSHRMTGLSHFECGLLNHLSTSPDFLP